MATPAFSRTNLIVSLFLDEYDLLDAHGVCPVEVLYHVGFSPRMGDVGVFASGRLRTVPYYSAWIEPFLIIDRKTRTPLLRLACPDAGSVVVTEVIDPGCVTLLTSLTDDYAEERLIEIPDIAWTTANQVTLDRIRGGGIGGSADPGDVVEMGWDTY
jgi:hypothetical protein